jgi:hypothetical protein
MYAGVVRSDGVAFTNIDGGSTGDDPVLATDRSNHKVKKDKSCIACWKCQQKGHYAHEYKNEKVVKEAEATLVTNKVMKKTTDTANDVHFQFKDEEDIHSNFLQHADYRSLVMNQASSAVPKAWILLDNQLTVDVFYNNKDLLRNVREAKKHMDIHCNAGVTSTSLIGDLPGYGKVWYHLNGSANILSSAWVKEKYRATFGRGKMNQFVVHKHNGSTRYFKELKCGLCFLKQVKQQQFS